MNYTQKFNRALLKAIRYNKIEKQDLNDGAIRKVSVKFSFSHEGITNYMSLESIRNAPGMEIFGFKEKHILDLSSWNSAYSAGLQEPIPVDIDQTAVKYISSYSIISEEEAEQVKKRFILSLEEYQVAMN